MKLFKDFHELVELLIQLPSPQSLGVGYIRFLLNGGFFYFHGSVLN